MVKLTQLCRRIVFRLLCRGSAGWLCEGEVGEWQGTMGKLTRWIIIACTISISPRRVPLRSFKQQHKYVHKSDRSSKCSHCWHWSDKTRVVLSGMICSANMAPKRLCHLKSNLISFERMCQPARVTHCEDCTKPTCVSGILRSKWCKKCAAQKLLGIRVWPAHRQD